MITPLVTGKNPGGYGWTIVGIRMLLLTSNLLIVLLINNFSEPKSSLFYKDNYCQDLIFLYLHIILMVLFHRR